MSEPKVLNLRTATSAEKEGAIYIGRGGPWGNKFIIGKNGDRNEVCDKFEYWVNQPQQAQLREMARKVLRGRNVLCYCEPERCHGITWLRIAND